MKPQKDNPFEPLSQVFEQITNPDKAKLSDQKKYLTEWSNLDKCSGGFRAGELAVIGGRPGMGKTQFLLNMMTKLVLNEDTKAAFVTLEDDLLSTGNRLYAILTGTPLEKLNEEGFKSVVKDSAEEATVHQIESSIYLMEAAGMDFESLMLQVNETVDKEGIRVLFIDNLQRLRLAGKQQDREQELSHIVQELKTLAMTKGILVIVSSQIHRWVEQKGWDKRPLLSDLLGSEEIECVADKVIFLYQPGYYGVEEDEKGPVPDGLTYVILAKNRHGFTGECSLLYQRDNGRFLELEREAIIPAGTILPGDPYI